MKPPNKNKAKSSHGRRTSKPLPHVMTVAAEIRAKTNNLGTQAQAESLCHGMQLIYGGTTPMAGLASLKEQLQEDLRTYLEGMPAHVIDGVCERVIERLNEPASVKAHKAQNEETLRVLRDALEVYFRIALGQLEYVAETIADLHHKRLAQGGSHLTLPQWNAHLKGLQTELKIGPLSGLGLYQDDVDPRARTAFELRKGFEMALAAAQK